jgi:hypothetical protein
VRQSRYCEPQPTFNRMTVRLPQLPCRSCSTPVIRRDRCQLSCPFPLLPSPVSCVCSPSSFFLAVAFASCSLLCCLQPICAALLCSAVLSSAASLQHTPHTTPTQHASHCFRRFPSCRARRTTHRRPSGGRARCREDCAAVRLPALDRRPSCRGPPAPGCRSRAGGGRRGESVTHAHARDSVPTCAVNSGACLPHFRTLRCR